jgi:hypothetical protein
MEYCVDPDDAAQSNFYKVDRDGELTDTLVPAACFLQYNSPAARRAAAAKRKEAAAVKRKADAAFENDPEEGGDDED